MGTAVVQGRACLRPTESSYYLYFTLPESFRARANAGLWVEVEYFGAQYGEFRLQYASRDRAQPWDGLYKPAEQRWQPDGVGLRRFRRAVFILPDFDPDRTQHLDASFRLEFRRELLVARAAVSLSPPAALADRHGRGPLPELRKMPGRLYPIDYLFLEITNACNFKCTWCPDDVMGRRRGFMKKERARGSWTRSRTSAAGSAPSSPSSSIRWASRCCIRTCRRSWLTPRAGASRSS